MNKLPIRRDDALIIVDVQKDFFRGGALAVEDADTVVPVLNAWIEAADRCGARVIASRDWHPADHVSFHSRGGAWVEHCVRRTPGAEFHDELQLPGNTRIVSKGTNPNLDNDSLFDGTHLADELQRDGIRRLWVGGLALDVCVRATVLHGCRSGFDVRLIQKATQPVNKVDAERVLREIRREGARVESDISVRV